MTSTRGGRSLTVVAWVGVWLLIVVVVVFMVIRVSSDAANLASGTIPPEGDFDRRYALNPWLAYLHILPGLIYLLGAPVQLSSRIRDENIDFHRSMGRFVIAAGLTTGIFAIVVGVVMPFGGAVESAASIVFGVYFLIALGSAYRAIKSGAVATHRRWMIRAFAIGVGVGMIRVVVGLGESVGIGMEESFGAAFWVAFVIMVALGELWLRMRPLPPVRERRVTAAPR